MANIEKPSIQYESVNYDMNYLRITKNRTPRPYIKKENHHIVKSDPDFSQRIFHRFPLVYPIKHGFSIFF